MEVLTTEQMKKVDEETINRICPGLELMERAGKAVADHVLRLMGESLGTPFKTVVFAGAGNNGGDAFVVARYLSKEGCAVSVHLLKPPESLPVDAQKNYLRLSEIIKANEQVRQVDASRPNWPEIVKKDLAGAHVVVDGLFGTGIDGPPRGRALEMIELMNASGVPVVSIDIPSGVQGSSGAVPGAAVRATCTVTIGRPKLGLLFYPGKSFVGEMIVADIGFPSEIVDKYASGVHILDWQTASERLPERSPDAHKYRCGTLLIIAGSRAYTGAALLSATAALRIGCGMVYLAVPQGIRDLIESASWETITIPLPETEEGTFSRAGLSALKFHIEKSDALAVGPGIGRHPETDQFVQDLLAGAGKPIVLDADGLNAFAGNSKAFARVKSPLVLTPHTGELERLVAAEVPRDPLGQIEKTGDVAKSTKAVLLHKGAPTLVASADGEVWINTSGSSALATAGSGDVLTGFVGSFLAQGSPALDAALIASFVHGKAGEYAAAEMGVRGVIAGDLLWEIGKVLLEIDDLLPDGSPYRPGIEESP
ncbi:MAG: NAD(P)H-hydrate dehydratase [Candidatus Latescibacteria bacterium]|nr:NAD(P)H-hydrate dehydratase [Candidatus Latescibacterota bacterium]NIM22601.1 NAD(P)H-hydrate dehydratase [Candidatus Latescibacterota bacterium]NIM64890.1 NAD(P)H-hydrate dehydratase [Candidatus Latescibacterota bacterium]NIO01405.1 NAD(P)H-hydrate dehydratase [Candidatus Latescibacterota bacterium]NIO27915.1 NAD(P)H-hydrate dehydratase [Candidatus Latescibacterota bacterium]